MANAFSDKITKDSISFGQESYINNNSQWQTKSGSVNYGNDITMGANSRCVTNKSFNNEKVDYLKFKVRLDADDHTLTTDNGHAVTGLCTITYLDEDNNVKTKQEHFYPKYIFEDTYKDDYVILQLGNDKRLQNLKVELINKENVPIKVKSTNMQLSRVVDEETFDDFATESLGNLDYVDTMVDALIDNDKFNDYIDNRLIIPLVDELPDVDDVPDGYICRLSTMR